MMCVKVSMDEEIHTRSRDTKEHVYDPYEFVALRNFMNAEHRTTGEPNRREGEDGGCTMPKYRNPSLK